MSSPVKSTYAFYDNPGEIEHFISWGGGEIVAIFHPPPNFSLIFHVFEIWG